MPAAIHAESEAVSLQPDGIHHLGVRAAEGHLVQVHVGAVGKVKFPFGFSSPLSFLVASVLQAGVLGFVIPPGPVAGKV